MSCSSIPANSSDLRSTRSFRLPSSRSRERNLSAMCRQASTAMCVESALGSRAAMVSINSLTAAAACSSSAGSPAVRSTYGRLRMVTRTGCFSVCLSEIPISIRVAPTRCSHPRLRQRNRGGLSRAQLIDLAQQFFDPAADLFALRVKRLDFIGKTRRLSLGLDGFLNSGLLFLAQPRHQLDGKRNALFETAKGIAFLFHGGHGLAYSLAHSAYSLAYSFSRAARADSFIASADLASSARLPKAASSCSATSASTLRFRSMPAAFSPCMNLL